MIVIKYGGHALPEPGKPDPMISLIANFFLEGNPCVLIHGGGPHINAELGVRNLETKFIGGYRQTTPDVFSVVQKVLSGEVLRTLVNQFIAAGVNAIGLSSSDGKLIRAKQMMPVELGQVGEIASVDTSILTLLISAGYFPVISPIATDIHGIGFNMNADIAAGAIGGNLQADEVIFMTDVAGIFRNYPDPSSLIEVISVSELDDLLGTFEAGMIPKAQAAISAIHAGAKKVRIIDGRKLDNLKKALSGSGGTLVIPK